MSFLIKVNRGCTQEYAIGVFQADGVTPEDLAEGDIAIVRVGRAGETALEITSEEPTAGGSTAAVSVGSNDVELVISGTDSATLSLPIYDMQVFVQSSGEDSPRLCASGALHVACVLPAT